MEALERAFGKLFNEGGITTYKNVFNLFRQFFKHPEKTPVLAGSSPLDVCKALLARFPRMVDLWRGGARECILRARLSEYEELEDVTELYDRLWADDFECLTSMIDELPDIVLGLPQECLALGLKIMPSIAE